MLGGGGGWVEKQTTIGLQATLWVLFTSNGTDISSFHIDYLSCWFLCTSSDAPIQAERAKETFEPEPGNPLNE